MYPLLPFPYVSSYSWPQTGSAQEPEDGAEQEACLFSEGPGKAGPLTAHAGFCGSRGSIVGREADWLKPQPPWALFLSSSTF